MDCLALLKKKWIVLLAAGILCAGIFVGYKYMMRSTYTLAYDGDVMIGKTLIIDDFTDRRDALRFDNYYRADSFLYPFLEATKNTYDYGKFDRGWEGESKGKQVEWLRNHIKIKYFGAGRMEVFFTIGAKEAMDLEYVEENGTRFLQDYLNFVMSKDSLGAYEVKNEVVSLPKETLISSRGVLVKYGVIGFVLGVVGAATVILVLNLRKGSHAGA